MATRSELHELLDAASDAMVVVDQAGRITAANRETVRSFGWSEADLTGEPLTRLIPVKFQPLRDGTISCLARRRDGSECAVEVSRRPIGAESEGRFLVTLRDLTQWRRVKSGGFRKDDQARAALEAIGDAVITTDAVGRITFLNPMAESVTGWDAEEALGQPLDVVLSLISESTRQPVVNTAARCLAEGRAIDLEEGVLLLRRDGIEVPIGDSAAPILARDGQTVGVVLVIQNESEKRVAGHRLSFEATHDLLTALINRREFERRLARVVDDLGKAPADHMLLFIDLDRFKVVNDSCGHDAGDDLLRTLAPLLGRQLRKRDTVARLGGDEFGVLLENCPLTEAIRIAEGIRAEVAQYRLERHGREFSIGASVGLVRVTKEGGMAAVLRAADAACYAAKEAGGNQVHIDHHEAGISTAPPVAARLVTRLARAVDEGHFQLYAQSILPIQREDGTRARFEILLRLPDGEGRVQSAADFLPQAQRHNLMPAIDRWVIREAIALLGAWHRDHPAAELPMCSINLSASALAEAGLLTVLEQQLSRHHIPPGTLCFEIAESAALSNLGRTARFLAGMRTIGCKVALEDFGGGITSFTYLQSLQVDFLKIGGAFVRGVAEDPLYGSIINAVNEIGKSMGILTIAKQVGTLSALEKLRALGIGYAQGRALTPPVPLTDTGGRVSMEGWQLSA